MYSWKLCLYFTRRFHLFYTQPSPRRTTCDTDAKLNHNVMQPDSNPIFTVFDDGCQISSHLLNKRKYKKENCEGWLLWGRLHGAPPSRCLRGVICREFEMRPAGRAGVRSWFTHTAKSHKTAGCRPAAGTDPSPRRSPSRLRTSRAAATRSPQDESQLPACCWHC